MIDRRIIFIAGLHRSGTSLLHTLLRSHPGISGFADTGVPEDEGQHLQSVYPPAKHYGGAGHFGFDPAAHMDEHHPLATRQNAEKIFSEWSRYWDLDKPLLLEKSPPNLLRTRFLQALFPKAAFVVLLRHPIAVAYATQKWSHTSIPSLLEHTLHCYESFLQDLPYLRTSITLRYEDLVQSPSSHLDALCRWLDIDPIPVSQGIREDINSTYFERWSVDSRSLSKAQFSGFLGLPHGFEQRANRFGYSLLEPTVLSDFQDRPLTPE
jgi:hypothetical protein